MTIPWRRAADTRSHPGSQRPALPPDAADQWQVYIQVADTDAALAKVTELGGTMLQPGIDTPYGRLAAAADPAGAPFKLVGPAGEGSA